MLSYRFRSEREIRQRLNRLSDDQKLIDKTIELLVKDKFLNDLEFAKWWVRQRSEFRPRGNRALSAELFNKGIDREIIEQVLLSREDEEKLAKKLLAKKKPSDRARAQRLLFSRGFSPDIVYSL